MQRACVVYTTRRFDSLVADLEEPRRLRAYLMFSRTDLGTFVNRSLILIRLLGKVVCVHLVIDHVCAGRHFLISLLISRIEFLNRALHAAQSDLLIRALRDAIPRHLDQLACGS